MRPSSCTLMLLGMFLTLWVQTQGFTLNAVDYRSPNHRISHHRRGFRRPRPAFQVVRSTALEARRLEILKFDKEVTNIRHTYNRDTGEFTAPVAGTYVFNLQLVASQGTYAEVSIQKTDSPSPHSHYVNVVKAMSNNLRRDDSFGGQGTAVAVLKLERGQKVTTLVTWISGKDIISGESKTSFSGYLLH